MKKTPSWADDRAFGRRTRYSSERAQEDDPPTITYKISLLRILDSKKPLDIEVSGGFFMFILDICIPRVSSFISV